MRSRRQSTNRLHPRLKSGFDKENALKRIEDRIARQTHLNGFLVPDIGFNRSKGGAINLFITRVIVPQAGYIALSPIQK